MTEASETLAPEVRPVQLWQRRVARVCEQCGAEFQALACKVQAGRGRFCSHSCKLRYYWAEGRMPRPEPAEKRFWRCLTPGAPDDCWPWQGRYSPKGYGFFGINGGNVMAHRFSYELVHGPIPEGMLACHKCDNPACCNPGHIFLGTHADNHSDRNAKGRQARGERSGRARLTEAEVREIRSSTATTQELAKRFGVGWTTVDHVRKGTTWRHIT